MDTKIDTNKVCDLLDSGESNMSEIARKCGVSRQAIHQRVTGKNRYIRKGCKSFRARNEIIKLLNDGKFYREISKITGLSMKAITDFVKYNTEKTFKLKGM